MVRGVYNLREYQGLALCLRKEPEKRKNALHLTNNPYIFLLVASDSPSITPLSSRMPPPKSAPSEKPLVFGKLEKSNPWTKILPWAFILFGIGAIAMMIEHNTARKPLTCQAPVNGSGSLLAFGTCTTE